MSKKRGLSLDDKRNVILSIYHEAKEPMNLKEIEAKASKAGVVQQTIKDVNQSLVDDDLVNSDKIGSAAAFVKKQSERETLQSQIANIKENIAEYTDKVKKAKHSRSDPSRAPKIQKYYKYQEEEKELMKILEDNKKNDPVEVKRMQDLCKKVKNGANRWTDNVWTLKSHMTKKLSLSSKDADKMLQIDGNFDYVEKIPEKSGKK